MYAQTMLLKNLIFILFNYFNMLILKINLKKKTF
jgi:hypothetical protein